MAERFEIRDLSGRGPNWGRRTADKGSLRSELDVAICDESTTVFVLSLYQPRRCDQSRPPRLLAAVAFFALLKRLFGPISSQPHGGLETVCYKSALPERPS